MAISTEELEKEKKYLENVKLVLKKIIDSDNKDVSYSKKNISDLKRFMWEQLSEYTDEERAIALHQVDTDVDLINRQIDGIAKYERAIQNPYFGKIVFNDFEISKIEQLYIGITTVREKNNFYVFDWRAPIASLFYNYELGNAEYEAPSGTIDGEILEKMQFKIENGTLIRCIKSDINIDDEYLQEILAQNSGDKMKNIVSTIQREQNEIIRNDSDNYLIVQGIAGSGKTSVAMHRIAYLLYRNINLNSNNILIFSPSDVFSDYISNVLPELGEENVLKSTFNEFSSSFLKPFKSIESFSEFLEKAYNDETVDISKLLYKMSSRYYDEIQNFMDNYEKRILFRCGINYNQRMVTSSRLQELFSKRYNKLSILERIELIAENVCSDLGIPKKKYFNTIKKKICEIANVELDYIALYNKFIDNIFKDDNEKIIPKSKVKFEDITGLLYIYFRINGFPNYSHIRQVVIDEAQDYTPFQMLLLRNIFKRASFTILGDVNQTINPFYHYESLEDLCNIFENSRYLELTKTYRSSEEIVEYTNKIIGVNNTCAIRRSTSTPITIKTVEPESLFETIQNDVEDMKKIGLSKIAIITKNVKQAKSIFKMYNSEQQESIQLIVSSEDAVKKPTVIIPSYLSKGLEFDAVISYNDIENEYTENEKNLYYVVCTRAQHKLSIYNEPEKILKKSYNSNGGVS